MQTTSQVPAQDMTGWDPETPGARDECARAFWEAGLEWDVYQDSRKWLKAGSPVRKGMRQRVKAWLAWASVHHIALTRAVRNEDPTFEDWLHMVECANAVVGADEETRDA